MNFTNVELVDGNYGAWAGSGMKRAANWYTSNTYGLGTTDDDDLDDDYYVIWNEWPIVGGTGTSTETSCDTSEVTALANIGIDNLYFATANGENTSNSLDCAIVRKSDRKAVRIVVDSVDTADYTSAIADNATFTAIDPKDGPWSPEIGRLINMGYI